MAILSDSGRGISGSLLLLMSIAAGATVANNYYAQSITTVIAADIHERVDKVNNLPVLSLLGYGFGLFFIVPLGDKVKHKQLMSVLLFLLSLALTGMFLAQSILVMMCCSFLIGCFSVAAQVMPPLVTTLDPENRTSNLSKLFLGMLVGILLSRIISGTMAKVLGPDGWRWVYLGAAVFMLVLAFAFQVMLPSIPQQFTGSYGALIRSTAAKFFKYPMLRQTCYIGALFFGAFNGFWTSLTLQLSQPPFGFNSAQIGMFGLVAVIGGLLAEPVAKWIGRRYIRFFVLLWAALIFIGAILIVKLWPQFLIPYVLTAILISMALQIIHVTNLARIFSLEPSAVGRLNTVYLFVYFLGGAGGTFICSKAMKAGGWPALTWLLSAMGIWAVLILVANRRALRMVMVSMKAKG